jgi:uncharacterized repeat protein (TIGR03803 family)
LPPAATNKIWTYTVIANNPVSYASPYVAVFGGVVYVSSHSGGDCSSCGSIFTLAPPESGAGVWTPTILYAFSGKTDGGEPGGPLAMDDKGVLYGTASDIDVGSYGTVFKLAPPSNQGRPWSFSVLHTFHGAVAGEEPVDGVILDKQGNLYGSEPFDDVESGKSFIFKLTPPSGEGESSESILYRFYPTSKCSSSGPLAIDANGELYGVFSAHASVTSSCNDSANEYVFQLAPSKSNPNVWVRTYMHTFTSGNLAGGYELTAPLTVDAGGNVYGTTLSGGSSNTGTAFVLQPRPGVSGKWKYSEVFDFPGTPKTGAFPNGGLVFDAAGNIYGSASGGGSGERGVVFSLTK